MKYIWVMAVTGIIMIMIYGCAQQPKKPNVLFISVDDLRPELGCYGNQTAISPNIDHLASEGAVFKNHFVQVPTCGASRYSLLTGMRPWLSQHLSNRAIETELSNSEEKERPETFIHQLKRNGYYTVGIGKISHSADGLIYGYNEEPSTKKELPYSWDELVFDPGKWGTGWNAFFGYASGENRQSLNKQVAPYEAGEVGDEDYVDGLTANLAIEKLRQLKNNEKPFFMGVGFFKPHLPFTAPKKYWDLYNRTNIPLAPNDSIPENINLKSLHGSGEFNQYKLTDEEASLTKPVSDAYARKLKHSYLAAVSYVDAQIGNVLKELRALGLEKNTIVVIWGDHGWHLGNHRVWGKHTLFDTALKSVLIIKDPRQKLSNKIINTVVESVDIYPSLLDLCQVEQPYATDGESFTNLMTPSDHEENRVAYSYFKNGISMRNGRYRLTKYFRDELPNIELYDHKTDPYETKNIAQNNNALLAKLLPVLKQGDTGIYREQLNK